VNRIRHEFFSQLTTRITDRRRRRALATNPASEKSGASKLKRLAAVRVHPIVRYFVLHLFNTGSKHPKTNTAKKPKTRFREALGLSIVNICMKPPTKSSSVATAWIRIGKRQ
jgi:hypothetical protein